MSQTPRRCRAAAWVLPAAAPARRPGSTTEVRSRASSCVYSFMREDFDRGLVIFERPANLNTLNHALYAFEGLLRDSNAFGTSGLRIIDVPKPIEDRLRNRASGNFVVKKLRRLVAGKRQNPGNHGDLGVFDAFQEPFENGRIEDRLSQRKLGTRFHLVIK